MPEKEKLDQIEERLRVVEGGKDYSLANMEDFCLVPDVVIPLKFKVLDFNKYKGTTCLKNHLKVYCRKLGAYAKNEIFLCISSKKVLLGQPSPGTLIWNLSESILGRT